MVAIAAAVLVAFIGGLYFITHHKKEEAEAMQNRQAAGNGLPPKPEERWRYIKELESRQPGVRAPTEIGRKVEGKRLTIKSQAQNKIFERNFKVVKIGIANKSIHCRILAPYKIARLIIS